MYRDKKNIPINGKYYLIWVYLHLIVIYSNLIFFFNLCWGQPTRSCMTVTFFADKWAKNLFGQKWIYMAQYQLYITPSLQKLAKNSKKSWGGFLWVKCSGQGGGFVSCSPKYIIKKLSIVNNRLLIVTKKAFVFPFPIATYFRCLITNCG